MASELFEDMPGGSDSAPDLAQTGLAQPGAKRGKNGATASLAEAAKISASSSTEPGGSVPLMASPTTGGEVVLPERIAETKAGQGDIFAGEGLSFARYFTKPGEDVFSTTEWDYRTSVISGEGGAVVFEQKDVEIPRAWSMLATNVVVSKYFRGKIGTPGRETSVKQLISRVADTIFAWGKQGNYFETDADADTFHDELKYLLTHQYMAFNSPVWFNLGVIGEKPQISACQPYDALVSTPQGLIPIGKLVEDNAVGTTVYDAHGTTRIVATKANGVKDVLRLHTTEGETLDVTADHLVWKMDTSSKFDDLFDGDFVAAGTLRVGDALTGHAIPAPVDAAIFATRPIVRMNDKQIRDAYDTTLIRIETIGAMNVYDIQTESGEYLSGNLRVHNCFINSVEDTMESILTLAKTEGMLFKWGSGTGTNISTLRSSNESLKGGGTASGPVSFMRGFDSFAGAVKSGGKTRRAAKMVILNTDHPDIEEFVECKADAEKKAHALIEAGYSGAFNVPNGAYDSVYFQNANHSVRATDDFMRAVELDRDWSTREVTTGNVTKTFKARELMRKMAEATWVCGDPGMQFDTTANRWHTCANTGRINASNPCSEFFFLDDTACNLASLNLMKFRTPSHEFDVEMFRHAVRVTATAQEIMVGNAAYPTDKITINSHDYRPLGLGYANLGALLMARGLAYDSDEGRAYAAAITAILSGEGYTQSARIARRIGAFAGYETNRQPMTRVMQMHRDHVEAIDKQYVPDDMMQAARKTWDACLDEGAKHGYRNAQISVLAPTGTIGFMMDCDTTGVEPDIAIVKFKSLVGGGFFKIVNQTVPEALERLGYSASERKAILEYIEEHDTIEGAPGLFDEHLSVFDCAFRAKNGIRSIHYMGHIKMMSAVQPFISGAISKTVNMPHEATPDEIAEAYLEAWKLGTKALAIYRDGSKKTQPLSTGRTETPAKKGVEVATVEYKPLRRKLPDERASLTHKFSVGGHEGYITIGTYPDGQVGEIFVTMSKEGSVVSGLMDSFATAISLSLQYGVPLKTLVDKFMHTRFEPSGFTGNPDIPMAKSIMDYLFRYLALKFLDKDERANVGLIADEQDDYPEAAPVKAVSAAPIKLATAKLVRGAQAEAGTPGQRGDIGAPAPATETRAGAAERQIFVTQADAPPCPECGSITTRNGACYRCANCGTSIGCS